MTNVLKKKISILKFKIFSIWLSLFIKMIENKIKEWDYMILKMMKKKKNK